MDIDRYHRQRLLPQIGDVGQARIQRCRALLIGCGALGSVIAEQLVRAGIGALKIVDRDVVDWTNLQRQVLFDESHARDGVPKAVAAATRLATINSSVRIGFEVADVDSDSIESLLPVDGQPTDIILDGTDNVQTRYLINDVAVKHGVPWVYGACVGVEGRVMAIVPGNTPCLRCVFPDPPGAGELPTCDTSGVLGPVAAIVASLQVIEAIKILLEHPSSGLISIDAFAPRFHVADTSASRRLDCPTCADRRFDFLNAPASQNGARLCGRNAVQIVAPSAVSWSLASLAQKLAVSTEVRLTPYLLRCKPSGEEGIEITVFPDARAIIHGTSDPRRARSLYARYVGA